VIILIVVLIAISIVFWRMFRVDAGTPELGEKPGTRWGMLLLLLLLTPFILFGLFYLMAALGYALPG
jgi:hypothetical protein